MNSVLSLFLLNAQYIPHGHCYLWQTPLVGLHVTADALIAIAYYLIPIFLIYFVRKIDELPFKNVFILFGAFIVSCGTAHLVEIWTLWHPNYWAYGILKAITALISLYTAFSLLPVIPVVLALPSPQHLANLNLQLSDQIVAKDHAQQEIERLNLELEKRVNEKTAALNKANQDLQESTKFQEKLTNLTPNILYIFDLKANRNVYCNPFITELLGYNPKELHKFQNSLLDELIHPEDIETIAQHHERCLDLPDDKYLEVEYRIRNLQGEWHWLHDKNAVFSRDLDGKPEQILGIAQDITQTKELNQKLQDKIAVLEKTNQARIQLAKMNEFIQACLSLAEAKTVVADLLKPLFPHTSGVVYQMNNSKNILDAIASWGDPHSEEHFDPKECWAIRCGNSHQTQSHLPGLYCSHTNIGDLSPSSNLCLPMIAKGETIGMLYLNFHNFHTVEKAMQNLAETVAQNLALSFANLKLQEKLRFQSLRDPLTGLYNRRYLQETLRKEIDRAHRKKQFVGVIMLDVDHFKRFNDIYGHSAGDLVLSKIGIYLLSEVRKYDIPCRYGGEELVIIMPDASIENTLLRAEEIRAGIKKIRLEHEGKQLDSISVSIGVSCFPDDSSDADRLIQAADKALYKAKEQGRDRVVRS